MKKFCHYRQFVIEIIAVSISAFTLSLFSDHFSYWVIGILVLLLIWHHHNENKLLRLLAPKSETQDDGSLLEYFSQSIAFYKKQAKKDKIKTLRLLSKLNKNIEYLPSGIIFCDNEGNISWCNQISQRLFDFYWHRNQEKNIFNVIFYDEFKHYFKQSKHHRPLMLMTHNQRYIEINLNPYDENLKMIIARDVTQMIRLLESRQTFLANINHELRTPLTVLQGYLELLETENSQSELAQKAIQAMQAQSRRMENLLKQLNLLAKIEVSDNKTHQPVNIMQLISKLKPNIEILQKDYPCTIDYDLDDISILGDEQQLQSAISNLIYNAIKHSGINSHIDIHWQYCGQGAEFKICDNGIGIEAKHIPHLTERFYRVDESRSNQTGGSGLGLAIVKHSLKQHHSSLQIESEPNQGSCFSFIIQKSLLIN
ncbi:phosphate regulon sensor histidine kinase PhoR [Muribacter muris]|uniref:Phosphate regulon sensor protein PhoR n=1 Tax=Muribacter muris TaxID=67855 RepID=A0A4Y9JUP2_9PAST|nr:phosphate regulon sensor histidine kinase PhoR [Muribacter muris]MBF0785937.1 phosphate regulon sensor histidine kinase PhoR [Muribacter muris]MBF0826122.1 phosphate regulon sensor histidine kinase PhoR [Muribacter muris]TFV08227.1 phosphate regulon sensor histidine kinase PhoR [Muribacter muris]